MQKKLCPYLGRPDDEKTRMDFPSEGNFCHKANPAAAVSREHQSGFCLTEQHEACPVFLAQAAAPLPAALASRETRQAQTSKTLRTPILLALVLIFALVGTWISVTRSAARVMSLANPPAPAATEVAVPFTGPDANPTPSQPGEPRPTHTRSSKPEAGLLTTRDCPLPQGWQTYTVQPTDSIYRISIVYAVRVETLQKANCLDNQTSLRPGEKFYVPARSPTATVTATATATPAPTRTRSPFIGSNPTQDPSSGDEDEDPTPTAQLRVPVVVTSVPTSTQPAQPTTPPATPTVRVVVPTVPTPTQQAQPTTPPATPTDPPAPTATQPTAPPATPTDEPVIVITIPIPIPTEEAQPTVPPPTNTSGGGGA